MAIAYNSFTKGVIRMPMYNQETRRKARAKFDANSKTKKFSMRLDEFDMNKFDVLCKKRGIARHELFSELMVLLK